MQNIVKIEGEKFEIVSKRFENEGSSQYNRLLNLDIEPAYYTLRKVLKSGKLSAKEYKAMNYYNEGFKIKN